MEDLGWNAVVLAFPVLCYAPTQLSTWWGSATLGVTVTSQARQLLYHRVPRAAQGASKVPRELQRQHWGMKTLPGRLGKTIWGGQEVHRKAQGGRS